MTSRRLLDTTAATLLAAANYIETHGHCKGRYGATWDDAACAVGAICKVENDMERKNAAATRLGEYLVAKREIAPSNQFAIPDWNDKPERTKAEVVMALRQAAITSR
jgi:hypothetical protein